MSKSGRDEDTPRVGKEWPDVNVTVHVNIDTKPEQKRLSSFWYRVLLALIPLLGVALTRCS